MVNWKLMKKHKNYWWGIDFAIGKDQTIIKGKLVEERK